MLAQKNERIKWLDIAKGFAIIFVVFGHTMRGGAGQRMVYSFHVAAFFFLSGMLCGTDRVWERIKKDFLRIMIPYYCFGLISIGIYAVLGSFAGAQLGVEADTAPLPNLLSLLYATAKNSALRFNAPLWFLPCLFIVKLIYYVLGSLFHGKPGGILAGTVVLAALGYLYTALDLPKLPFALDIGVKLLPFFALGRIFFRTVAAAPQGTRQQAFCLSAGILLLLAAFVIGYYAPKVNYSGDTFPNIPAFCVTGCLGSVGICLLSMGISRFSLLEHIGRNSLAILVMHKFPVLLLQTVGPFKGLLLQYDSIEGNLFGGLPVTMISIFLCLVAAFIIDRLFPFLLGHPMKKQ